MKLVQREVTMIPDNKEMNDALQLIEESEMTGAPKNGGNTDGYGDGAAVEVGLGGTVKNTKEQGAQDAPKEFDGEGSVDTPAINERDAGAANSQDEFEGETGSANDASTEKRDAGAKNAPHEFETVDAFRDRIRTHFGLPLDSKINKGNNGIQR